MRSARRPLGVRLRSGYSICHASRSVQRVAPDGIMFLRRNVMGDRRPHGARSPIGSYECLPLQLRLDQPVVAVPTTV